MGTLPKNDLQRRATKKLGSGDWAVTSRALQQATPWQVARLKASWFGNELVYDLCCGIGGDAIQLAKRGPIVGVDCDPELIAMAMTNLSQTNSGNEFTLRCADVTSFPVPSGASIHIDPDRRNEHARTIRPEHYRPAWDEVCRMISQVDAAVVKLAPAATFRYCNLPSSHRCWISLQGSVREQSLLCGRAINRASLTADGRSAVSIGADGHASWFRPVVAPTPPIIRSVDQPMQFLMDPDAAIRAANLTETFAQEFGLRFLDHAAGFLTGDETTPQLESLATTGPVIWSGACDDRKLRRELRSRNIYPETIKVRGTDHDPAVLSKRYRKCGETPVILWIGRKGKRVFAAITELP